MQQKHYILIGILILAFFSANFIYPNYYNKAVDIFNQKFSQNLPHFWNWPFRLGLDLQGGVSLTYQADLSTIGTRSASDAMSGLRDVIERRINIFGVTEPIIQVQGQDRLIVELPGVKDVSQAIQMIGQTPYLEFLESRTEAETKIIIDKIKEVQDASAKKQDIDKIEDWQIAFQNPYFKATELTGQYLKSAQVSFEPTTGKPSVDLQFDDKGSQIFADITGRNVGKSIAIFLDGKSIIDTNGDGKIDETDLYAPVVQEQITGGKAVITGNMNIQIAKQITGRLTSGALPIKIGQPISQNTIGPTLGSVSLEKSLMAGLYGLLAVMAFMIIFYRFPGVLASIALIFYVFIALALFKLFGITLTLAGIGGFILSIGMAVDANILIFARTREEIKGGQTVSAAVEDGFRRAWPSIRDSNINSILICIVLFTFATSFIKGFSLALAIGILVSMFSAIFITRILLMVFVGKRIENHKWLL